MNEAFRVVRTNLEFILGFEGGHHVIMMTSMNPGSGKTFISVNLSISLAIKGKKVIAVDLDMRKASLSKFVNAPALGISNYLSAQVPDYHDVIVKLVDWDVLPVGTIPPNPTELLFNPRLDTLMNKLKEEYDYVFIDCPPVEIVADAAIISRYAEMTLSKIGHNFQCSQTAPIRNSRTTAIKNTAITAMATTTATTATTTIPAKTKCQRNDQTAPAHRK